MGAWIEIYILFSLFLSVYMSHPTMGAWIEMLLPFEYASYLDSRTPRWVRGLKF